MEAAAWSDTPRDYPAPVNVEPPADVPQVDTPAEQEAPAEPAPAVEERQPKSVVELPCNQTQTNW
jgi:hypothetical protein